MLYTALLSLHLVGVVLGLGAATVGDLLVLHYVTTGRSAAGTEFPTSMLTFLSRVIWGGLSVLTVSGLGLFAMKPAAYLHNSGFLAKMAIVLILGINGVVLHHKVLPTMEGGLGRLTLLAGAVSSTSWYAAFLIAIWKTQLHLSFMGYMTLYVIGIGTVWVSLYATVAGTKLAVPSVLGPPFARPATTRSPALHPVMEEPKAA